MSNTRSRRLSPQLLAAFCCVGLMLAAPLAGALMQSFSITSNGTSAGFIRSQELYSAPALLGVKFYFSGGDDHEIKRIGNWQSPGKMNYAFEDENAGDRFVVRAGYRRVLTNVLHEASRNDCRGSCALPIHAESDKIFVLAGFEFSNRHGEDRNLRRIAILPELHNGRINVTFSDDSGFDFAARVQYLLLPRNATRAVESYSTTNKQRSVAPRSKADRVLQGFDLRFTNGDHHVGDVTVWAASEMTAYIKDKNDDDGMRGEVRVVVLR